MEKEFCCKQETVDGNLSLVFRGTELNDRVRGTMCGSNVNAPKGLRDSWITFTQHHQNLYYGLVFNIPLWYLAVIGDDHYYHV